VQQPLPSHIRRSNTRRPSRIRRIESGGLLTDGFDNTTKSLRTLFPGARLGYCLRHAINKLPGKRAAITSPVRKALRSRFHTLLYRARQRKGLRMFALGQQLRHFADHVTHTAGTANGDRDLLPLEGVREWIPEDTSASVKLVVMPGADHTSFIDHREAVWNAIDAFLR
jgi:pimeloyl-ACP methyl ester carboxylesterase